MALSETRYLGAKNRFAGKVQPPAYGGFNLGNPPPIQSSVATPNPASAGVSGGPAGGMSVGQRPTDEPDSPADGLSTPAGNANVTGFDPGLAGLGLGFAMSLAGLPGLSSVTAPFGASVGGPAGGFAGGLLGGRVQDAVTGKALGAIPSSMVSHEPTTFGQQATYTGPTDPISLIAGLLSGNIPTVTTADPTPFGLANQAQVAIPSPSPNQFSHVGDPTGVPGETTGQHTAGHPFGYPSNDPANNPFHPEHGKYFSSPVQPDTNIPDATFPTLPDVPAYPDLDVNFPDVAPTGEGDSPTGPPASLGEVTGLPDGIGFADGPPGGDAPAGGDGGAPGGSAGAPAGGGDSGNVGDFKHGGRVRRPDPRKLSAMLKRGAKVTVGDHDDETDDVPVRLTRGEIVMNRPAATAHDKQLNKWNEQGRREMGGMGVGPSGPPRSTGQGGRAGGFGVTGRPRDGRR